MRFFLRCENNRENFLFIDRKTFIAYPNMCHFVIVKIGRGCKGLATHLALVWLFSSVDPPVRVQAGAGAEPLVAEVALVRPLPGVGADVSLQETRTVELFATRVAGEQSLGGAVAAGATRHLVPPRVTGQGEGEGVQGEGG